MSGERVRMLHPSETAWIAALPCAVAVSVALVWLGPVLGHGILAADAEPLWPRGVLYVFGQPEPVKHARYLIALLGPVLLVGAIVLGSVRRVGLSPVAIRGLVLASQAALVALLVAAVLGQHKLLLPSRYTLWPVFSGRKLAFAALLVLLFLLAVRRDAVAKAIARASRDTRALRIACVVVAGVLAAVWLLAELDTERSAGESGGLYWTQDDPYAVLDGRTPLVDFHPLYGQLLPYGSAVVLRAFGGSSLVFTLLMAGLSVLALLLVYATLRRVARSSALALALYLPLLAAGFLLVGGFPNGVVVSPVRLAAMWPMRYGGAYLLLWLTARHLDRAAPRRVFVLAFIAGVLSIDNLQFGGSAFAASVVALLCFRPRWSWRALSRLAAELTAGLLAAVLVVALATFVRSGELPSVHILLEFPRIFGTTGYTAIPMPTLGIHLALYATFVAAIATAAARWVSGREDPLLTGMLAWSGVFGLLAGAYFLGRSDELKLVSLFSAWLLAVAFLAVAVLRGLAARGWRRPGIPEVVVLFGLVLALCSWNEVPRPWSQVARLRDVKLPLAYQKAADRFVADHTRPGDKVAIFIQNGHRIAYELGITNVAPYAFIEAMVVKSQMTTLLDTVRREHAHRIFIPVDQMVDAQLAELTDAGFAPQPGGDEWFAMWSDDAGRPRSRG
jgi:hypothetical protein